MSGSNVARSESGGVASVPGVYTDELRAELADESLAEKVARRSAEMLRDGLRKYL